MRFNFEPLNFILGFVAGAVTWWALGLAWPLLRQMVENLRTRQQERTPPAANNLETAYRKILFRQTQDAHLAASLFALDEIALEPRLLAPPAYTEPATPRPHLDVVDQALPYMPAQPELACYYDAPNLSLSEAISGGVNLVITGQPGAGKTTALAILAAQIARRDPAVESLHETIPFFIHVADLGLPINKPKKPADFLTPIADKLTELAGVFEAGKLPGFIEFAFRSGRALFLLDGVDELPQAALQEVNAYLRVILRQFPQTRIITTASPEFLDGLLALDFTPMAILPWSPDTQRQFRAKWSALWQQYVATEAWAQNIVTEVDTILLNRWVDEGNLGLSPLEYTLKIWAAYAGDVRGARLVDAIESHLRRLLPERTPFEALFAIGTQASLSGTSIFDSQRAREWTRSFEPPAPFEQNAEPAAEDIASAESAIQPEGRKNPRPNAGLVSQMIASGILTAHGGSRIRFSHPIFLGYLAGRGLNPAGVETVLKQPAWAGQTTSLRYLAAFGDASALVNHLLNQEDHLLLRPRLLAGRLLREAPAKAPWRNNVMLNLIQILQDEVAPAGLRGQALAAFALSGDPAVAALFRQLLGGASHELHRLAALGAGLLRDVKAVDDLVNILHSSSGPARQAACLALVKIGTPEALNAIAGALIGGDEQLRISAAEALASHPIEGHETLRDGITNTDILVRRAIVYGLARVRQEWAVALLERIPVDDDQWVVRNAALEMLAEHQRTNPRIPQREQPAHDTPWLIEFASKYGRGVTPGQPATDLYLLAVKDENPEIQQAGLHSLRNTPSEGVFSILYPLLYGSDMDMREAVYRVLAEMAQGGAALPPPKLFGLG